MESAVDAKESKKDKEGGLTLPSLDNVLTRGGGGIIVALMFWMNSSLSSMQTDLNKLNTVVTKVTVELETASPKDVKESVNELQRTIITKEDINLILRADFINKMDYNIWKKEIEQRITRLESK